MVRQRLLCGGRRKVPATSDRRKLPKCGDGDDSEMSLEEEATL